MLKAQVKIGRKYAVKFGSKNATVILESFGLGGFGRRKHTTYLVRNVETQKTILLKSAARLLSEVQD